MKKNIFTRYVDAVCKIFDTTPSVLFSSKKHTFRDAKNLLMYLCLNRNIRQSEIIEWIDELYDVKTRRHDTKRILAYVEKMMNDDADYSRMVNEINNSI